MNLLTHSPAFTRSAWFRKVERITAEVDTYLIILLWVLVMLAGMLQK